MKKIKIPKGAKEVIFDPDLENGRMIIEFVPKVEKEVYKVGKWYTDGS
jgi:hypothetical protein